MLTCPKAINATASIDRALADFPRLADARALEVLLSPGQVLYVPTYWHHFIVSMGTTIQCNSRSGHDWPRELPHVFDQMKHCMGNNYCRDARDCTSGGVCVPSPRPPDDTAVSALGRCMWPVGAPCKSGGSCATGVCARAGPGRRTCRLGAGAACASDDECASGRCGNRVCA